MVYYVLDSGLPLHLHVSFGRDTVGDFQDALKKLAGTKEIKECNAEDIEVYPPGTTKANFRDGTRKPLKPSEKMPKGSNSTNYFFVHVPQNEQSLNSDKRVLRRGRSIKNSKGQVFGMNAPRMRSMSPTATGRPQIKRRKPPRRAKSEIKPRVAEGSKIAIEKQRMQKDDDRQKKQAEKKVKDTVDCYYQVGIESGMDILPNSTQVSKSKTTVGELKRKILSDIKCNSSNNNNNNNGSFLVDVQDASDIRILLPDKKELDDSQIIPDISTADKPFLVTKIQRCKYQFGKDGEPEITTMMAGDTIAVLKDLILKENGNNPYMKGVQSTNDFKIISSVNNGKEMKDGDTLPDDWNETLIVHKLEDCFYKLGNHAKPNKARVMCGDNIVTLKESILASSCNNSFMQGINSAKDIKIFLPGHFDQNDRELHDSDKIPPASSFSQALVVKRPLKCFYKIGQDGKARGTSFMSGDNFASLKGNILSSNYNNPYFKGINDPENVMILSPEVSGKPGKELHDNDIVPGISTLEEPFVVKKALVCFYKVGEDGKPNQTRVMFGDSIANLKKVIINEASTNPGLQNVKNTEDIKVFFPGGSVQHSKELSDTQVVPDSSSYSQPLVVKTDQDCFYKFGKYGKSSNVSTVAGDSIDKLKERIFGSSSNDPYLKGARTPKELKIFLPGDNGRLGRELKNSESVPESSSINEPLVVARAKNCFFHVHGESIQSVSIYGWENIEELKKKLFVEHGDTFEEAKDASHLKLFQFGSENELKSHEQIPPSSPQKPLVLTTAGKRIKQDTAANREAEQDEHQRKLAAQRAKISAPSTQGRKELSPRKQRMNEAKKEPTTKKRLDEGTRRKCYMWYARLGQPTKTQMIQKVKNLSKSCDITVEDVEALPWVCGGAMLPVKELNELIINGK